MATGIITSTLVSLLLATQTTSTAQSSSWLDRATVKWNTAGAALPGPPAMTEPRQALMKRCPSSVASGASADAIEKAGWVPILHVDRRISREDVEVVGGMSSAGPACELTAFQLFAFAGGRFAGTLSPAIMRANRDGVAGAVRITGPDALTAEFARYLPGDAECCPSSIVRVTYRINRGGAGPVLDAVEVRAVR
jgi:hypothetical protein